MLSLLIAIVLAKGGYRPEALGPLNAIKDWDSFAADLRRLKAAGVQAFATDVWWSKVELQDEKYDWTYYDQMSRAIVDADLKWIPILSTHQCGEEGKECNIPVPEWTGIKTNPNMQFVDVFGVANTESLSPWSGDYIYKQYDELFSAFATRYAPLKEHIVRIDLSGGTSGELRYPSYSGNWTYPARGELQAYSDAAVASFQEYALKKYSSVEGVAKAWGTTLSSTSDILPPCDVTVNQTTIGVCAGKTGKDTFFSVGVTTPFGKDFGDWYQSSLLTHSEKLAKAAHKNFDPVFGCTIAMKVAGIHWQYFHPTEPRSAERSAGYWDYATLIQEFTKQGLEVTFTAIEMDDQNAAPYWSGAKTLTREFYQLCKDLKGDCGSENALPVTGPQGNSYKNMRQLLSDFPVASLTFLRYNNLAGSVENTQAYANYVSAIRGEQKSLFFRVANVTTSFGQSLGIVGNIPELGNNDPAKALRLAPFKCSGSKCQWAGNAMHSLPLKSTVEFKVVLMDSRRTVPQCTSYNITQTTKAVNAIVNLGQGETLRNDIQTVNFGDLTFCPLPKPSPEPSPVPTKVEKCFVYYEPTPVIVTSTTASVEPTPTSEPVPDDDAAFVRFEITHQVPKGDALYVVGSLNDWAICDAISCQGNQDVWTCGPVEVKNTVKYEWKTIIYGDASNTTCEEPKWKDGPNEVFTASKGLLVQLKY